MFRLKRIPLVALWKRDGKRSSDDLGRTDSLDKDESRGSRKLLGLHFEGRVDKF